MFIFALLALCTSMLVYRLKPCIGFRYGVILEKFRKQDPALMERIKGCVVDSAPAACPDPQVCLQIIFLRYDVQ